MRPARARELARQKRLLRVRNRCGIRRDADAEKPVGKDAAKPKQCEGGPCLVMKGSPVRVRPSALEALQISIFDRYLGTSLQSSGRLGKSPAYHDLQDPSRIPLEVECGMDADGSCPPLSASGDPPEGPLGTRRDDGARDSAAAVEWEHPRGLTAMVSSG